MTMKANLIKAMLAGMMAITLAGCGSGSESAAADSSSASSSEPASAEPAAGTEAAPSEGGNVIASAFGKAEGGLSDTMKTAFMEFTVNSAYLTSQYQTITADAGMALLVLNITTHVTQSSDLTLYDTDYQIQWGGTGALDYSVPVTYRDEWGDFNGYKKNVNLEGVEGIFPGVAVLKNDETLTADFVYQLPAGFTDFMLLFQEYLEDESVGDRFVVKFTAEQR